MYPPLPEPTQTVPHSGAPGAPAFPVQGQGVLVVWVKLGEQSWLLPEERGQLWVTDPRRAATAATTSGLARAARREGRGAALISRPGTRAGGRRGGRRSSSSSSRRRGAQARPWPAGRRREPWRPAMRWDRRPGKAGPRRFRTGRACLPSCLGATRHSN